VKRILDKSANVLETYTPTGTRAIFLSVLA